MIYFDFEYRNPFVLDDLVLVALLDSKNPEKGAFSLILGPSKAGNQWWPTSIRKSLRRGAALMGLLTSPV
jgi:hypothetical protein